MGSPPDDAGPAPQLEHANIAVVGISNWTLDPAKMNRAVHLFRPAPTLADLSATAEGMVRNANLKGYLFALSRSYGAVSESQECADFWGVHQAGFEYSRPRSHADLPR